MNADACYTCGIICDEYFCRDGKIYCDKCNPMRYIIEATTETVQEKKEKQRLRKNQLARERYARVKSLPEIYNILSDEGLTPVDTKPSLLTHFCKDIVITKTAKILFYIKKETDEGSDTDDGFEDCEDCGYTHHYEDKCPKGANRKNYEKWRTSWCYANNKNAVCNCSQPCSRP